MSGIPSVVVAIACSAGGLPALRTILSELPADFPAAIIVALHRGDDCPDLLIKLLAARTALQVKTAEAMEELRSGCVYVCPPGRHIEMTTPSVLHTWRGPRIRYVRPSADLLFDSIADTIGERGICVVLTGCGADGAMATRRVRGSRGFVIAQDERTADFPDMPIAAVEFGRVDLVLPLNQIAFALVELSASLYRDSSQTHSGKMTFNTCNMRNHEQRTNERSEGMC